jgi:glycogen debranching enzyme
MYGFCKRGLLDVVLGKHNLEGNLCATGRGLVETRELQRGGGMKTLDIAAYTYEALLCLAELAAEAGDSENVLALQEKAQRLRTFINAAWWIEEEGLYGDIYISANALAASHSEMRAEKTFWPGDLAELEHSDILMSRFAKAHQSSEAAMRQERPWLLKHMIMATPLEAGLAPHVRAERVLRRLESDEFNGPWGIYLNPETQRVTMTLPNGLMAAAEARYGRMDQALAYCHKIASAISCRMPGAYSEILPDGGCFIQAWSSYGIIWPVIHFFLGFQPDAAKQRVRCFPHLPSAWQHARLQDVRVGSASFNLYVIRTEQDLQVTLETSDPSYEVTLGCAYPVDRDPLSVTLNGVPVSFTRTSIGEGSLEQRDSEWCIMQTPSVKGLYRYELLVVQ